MYNKGFVNQKTTYCCSWKKEITVSTRDRGTCKKFTPKSPSLRPAVWSLLFQSCITSTKTKPEISNFDDDDGDDDDELFLRNG